MDFTYMIAPMLAFFVGLCAQVLRIVRRARWTKLSSLLSVGAAFATNGLLLLNWRYILDWGVGFAIMDLGIIAVLTLVGFAAIAPGAIIVVFRKSAHGY